MAGFQRLVILMQNSQVLHQSKNGWEAKVPPMRKSDAFEMHWFGGGFPEVRLQKLSDRFPPNGGHNFHHHPGLEPGSGFLVLIGASREKEGAGPRVEPLGDEGGCG